MNKSAFNDISMADTVGNDISPILTEDNALKSEYTTKRRTFKDCLIVENDRMKKCMSPTYNYAFDKDTGFFIRYGKTLHEDPEMAPAFEILDWEISTSCKQGCPMCYKNNVKEGITIDFDTFKNRLDKIISINPLLTQIAFGIGDTESIPHLIDILSYTRSNGIIPNITVNSSTSNEDLIKLSSVCGAIAISNYNYDDTHRCIDTLRSQKFEQVNIHQVLSKETLEKCYKTIDEYSTKINAIVFLWVKPKGRASYDNYHSVSQKELNELIAYAMSKKAGIGFDSCSANYVMKSDDMEPYQNMIEPCESSIFSIYQDVEGNFYPCSFSEGHPEVSPIHIDEISSMDDLWYSDPVKKFRMNLSINCRSCPIYNLTPSS